MNTFTYPLPRKDFHKCLVLVFLKTRCFLGILANKSRWVKLTSLSIRYPLGRYCFQRLPDGIYSTSDVFQQEVTSITSYIHGSANSQNDITVWGRTLAEHNELLNKAFLKIRKGGLKLNNKKCQIGLKFIVSLGHIISSESVKIDPAKIEAITKSSLPNSMSELQRLLSISTYLRKFIPNLAKVTFPILTLIKKEVEFKLKKSQLDAIGKLKLLVTTTSYLKVLIQIYKPVWKLTQALKD